MSAHTSALIWVISPSAKNDLFIFYGWDQWFKINIDSKQPTCIYQLRFSRGPCDIFFHDYFYLLKLVNLAQK